MVEFLWYQLCDLFGSNLLALTWTRGEHMPAGLVDGIIRALGLERESEEEALMRRRSTKGGGANSDLIRSLHRGRKLSSP